jgi:hypothetical protein
VGRAGHLTREFRQLMCGRSVLFRRQASEHIVPIELHAAFFGQPALIDSAAAFYDNKRRRFLTTGFDQLDFPASCRPMNFGMG